MMTFLFENIERCDVRGLGNSQHPTTRTAETQNTTPETKICPKNG